MKFLLPPFLHAMHKLTENILQASFNASSKLISENLTRSLHNTTNPQTYPCTYCLEPCYMLFLCFSLSLSLSLCVCFSLFFLCTCSSLAAGKKKLKSRLQSQNGQLYHQQMLMIQAQRCVPEPRKLVWMI